jgi:hypothetical protein
VDELMLDDVSQSIGIAATSLIPDVDFETDLDLPATRLAIQKEPRLAPLISMGLLNNLIHAKAENQLKRRDDLLEELRQFQQSWKEDAAIRETLVRAEQNL